MSMLYTFVKKDGNVVRVGAECEAPQALLDVLATYSADGYEVASAEEHDQQVIDGASNDGDADDSAAAGGEGAADAGASSEAAAESQS